MTRKVKYMVQMKLLALNAARLLPIVATSGTTTDVSNFQPLEILRTIYVLFMSVVAIMGGIQVVKGVQEWSTAMQQNDSAGTNAAIKSIVGGAIQAFISVLMSIFGIVI